MSKWLAILGFASGICAAVVSAVAQENARRGTWSVGLTGGTLGGGPEVSYRAGTHLGLRANAAFLTFSHDEDIDDIDYDADMRLRSFGAMLDWYPVGGGFRISAGGRINDNEIAIFGAPGRNVRIGDTTYTPAQVGSLSGKVTTEDFSPMLTLGFGGTLAKGFTVAFEAGVMWQGEPRIDDLQATGSFASLSQFQADLEQEEQRIEDDVDDYQLWPIAQIELLYRF
jgi:hypothetical protein